MHSLQLEHIHGYVDNTLPKCNKCQQIIFVSRISEICRWPLSIVVFPWVFSPEQRQPCGFMDTFGTLDWEYCFIHHCCWDSYGPLPILDILLVHKGSALYIFGHIWSHYIIALQSMNIVHIIYSNFSNDRGWILNKASRT